MYWRDVVILRAVVTDTDADGYPAEVVKETRVFAALWTQHFGHQKIFYFSSVFFAKGIDKNI